MQVVTDFPERLTRGTTVFVGREHKAMTVSGARSHPDGLRVKLVGIDTPEAAGALRHQSVYVKTADRPPLPKGMYYHHEVVGFRVVNEQGETIGTLTEIMQTGANDVYVIAREHNGEVLLPAIASVIINLDAKNRVIRVREMPGLLDAGHEAGKDH